MVKSAKKTTNDAVTLTAPRAAPSPRPANGADADHAGQVQRLGIEGTLCQSVLDALVTARFLCVKSDGSNARLTGGDLPRPRPAKASAPRVVRAAS
jgi:hypothetical protein